MRSLDVGDRARGGLLAIAAVVVIVAVAGAAPAGAATQRSQAFETVRPAGMLGPDPGFETKRRGRRPTGSSGAFVYRKGTYSSLAAIPGAALLAAVPGFQEARVAQTHFAINDRARPPECTPTPRPGRTASIRRGSQHGFVKNRRGEVTSFDLPGAGQFLVNGNNDRGQVVGVSIDRGAAPGPDGLLPPGSVHSFIRERRGRTTGFDVPFPTCTPSATSTTAARSSAPTTSRTGPTTSPTARSRKG